MSQIRFTKEHEWVRMEGDVAVCGITGYAQKALGDIVYVELPEPGKKVTQGGEAAVIESSKAASEIYSPIDGEVVAANENLSGDPGKVNTDALGDGWIFKLKPSNPSQIDSLMNEAEYKNYIKE
ncbi:MAG: glycine cleavage system protein GcvH [Alphaproteobacteria bacterium]